MLAGLEDSKFFLDFFGDKIEDFDGISEMLSLDPLMTLLDFDFEIDGLMPN